MKKGIHPKYGKSVVHCGCGNTFDTCSTVEEIHAEICSMCHPLSGSKRNTAKITSRRPQKTNNNSWFLDYNSV
jgi:large subunit ribosomal protein L31